MRILIRIISFLAWTIFLPYLTFAQRYLITKAFDPKNLPPTPNYRQLSAWAAHPKKNDPADKIPVGAPFQDQQAEALVDVFFIHPTIYGAEPTGAFLWNGDIQDDALNRQVDESTILNQASVFNGTCRVFAPRYRQAHYSVFLTSDSSANRQALALAYEDVKNAFLTYLETENKGRPFVIASHSQGTLHARRLLQELIDGKPLQKQMITAYLVGIAVQPDSFQYIQPSQTPDHVGGFTSWNTYLTGFYPPYHANGLKTAFCINPITWTLTNEVISHKNNPGGVGLKFKWVNQPADAQVHQGMLWIHQPYVPGRFLLRTKIWHRADINLYWGSIRENVALRTKTYFSQIQKP